MLVVLALTHSWGGGDKRVPTFPLVICLKVNLIVQLEFKLTHYDIAVQHMNYNAMETLSNISNDVYKSICTFNVTIF